MAAPRKIKITHVNTHMPAEKILKKKKEKRLAQKKKTNCNSLQLN